MTTTERDAIFEKLKNENIPQETNIKKRSMSQVELPNAREKDLRLAAGSAIETESF